jgi:hypothetical protein
MMKNKNMKKDLDCAGFREGFLWKPYENFHHVLRSIMKRICGNVIILV